MATKVRSEKTTTVTIVVRGAWADVYGISARFLDDCLSFADPKRFFNQAWKEGRWDGLVRLYWGRTFPAGLVEYVSDYFTEHGLAVKVERDREEKSLALPIKRTTLPGIKLWDHQMDGLRAVLQNARGTLKMATGSGKTELVIAGAKMFFEKYGWRSLVVEPKVGLVTQTVERAQRYLTEMEVGQCGDGKKQTGDLVIGTAQTLIGFQRKGRREPDPMLADMIANYEVLWLDESHHSSSTTWNDIAMASGAIRRYGLSGTPLKNSEIADMRLIGATGPIIYEAGPGVLIEQGLAAQPKIAMVAAENASGPTVESDDGLLPAQAYRQVYDRGLIENDYHNQAVIDSVAWLVDRKKRVLVLTRRKDHWQELANRLESAGFAFSALWGDTPTAIRTEAKRALDAHSIDVVLATTIFDEGEDVPGIDALVLAEGVKSTTNVLQRIGRGMRRKKGLNEVWVVDFMPLCHTKLEGHAKERLKAYREEGYEYRVVESWPEEGAGSTPDLFPFEDWNDEQV